MTAEDVLQEFVPYSERILITGCHGLLGQKLFTLLSPTNTIIGLDMQPGTHLSGRDYSYHTLDITRGPDLIDAIVELRPRYIINTAAMTGVDHCEDEKEACWRVNVLAVESLIKGARKVGAHLVQVSSDYVFNGKQPPYCETDRTDPLGYYGKSKLASENVLRGSDISFTIARTQVLFGVAPKTRPNFVDFIRLKLEEGLELSIVDDQLGNPTLADDLATGIARIIQLRNTGIYHISGSESISRYEFACKIAAAFGEDPSRIKPIKTAQLKQKAPRPENSTFCLDKINRELKFRPRSTIEALMVYKEQLHELQITTGGNAK
ncbi:dTDP-4-dehydrorhamnose reductase [bacterium]|nr:dTDP-4-dehydrorhamnose reductase [bacterium]MBU1651283.1 dTDP-4-dehydrorhamnose reductase [bacterium]MBU1880825.1 dTDP-4-dehydrorhamnose reductase [bacterium]